MSNFLVEMKDEVQEGINSELDGMQRAMPECCSWTTWRWLHRCLLQASARGWRRIVCGNKRL